MEIKGIKEGILITLDDQAWEPSKDTLIEKIKAKQDFFQGARLVLDVRNMVLSVKDLIEVINVLEKQYVHLCGVLSTSLVTQESTQHLGLITKLEKPKPMPDQKDKPLDIVLAGEKALLIHRTMRWGDKVSYQGHVVVLGDIEPGAEVTASGSVIVWGHLRGFVHAGAEGDQNAVVCALDLSPSQLRITSKIATTSQDQQSSQPEIASIADDQIIAEPWHY